MTTQEKMLYHQIHPLKLFTDISAEFDSLYLFWRHNRNATLWGVPFLPGGSLLDGCVVGLVTRDTLAKKTAGARILSRFG